MLRIDAHMHLYRDREDGLREKATYDIWEYGKKADVTFSKFAGDPEDARKAMREAGFSHAIVTNLFAVALLPQEVQAAGASVHAERLIAGNEWACSVGASRPELTIFVAADPTVLGGEAGAAHLREMANRHGAKGIKLHPVLGRFEPDHPGMQSIYKTCLELGLMVLSHSGPAPNGMPWAEPSSFANVVRTFPNLVVILAHLGGGAWRKTAAFAREFPNVFFDLSEIIAWTGAANAPSKDALARLILEIGAERVLLGTDFPWYDLSTTADQVAALPLLSEEQKQGIIGENAARLLKV